MRYHFSQQQLLSQGQGHSFVGISRQYLTLSKIVQGSFPWKAILLRCGEASAQKPRPSHCTILYCLSKRVFSAWALILLTALMTVFKEG